MKKPDDPKAAAGNTTAPPGEALERDGPAGGPARDPKKNSEGRQIMRGLSMVGNLSFGMAACVFVGFFLGRWLDGLFGTSPVLLILLTVLGVAASYKMLFDAAKKG